MEFFTEVGRYQSSWKAEMDRTPLKYRHVGTGEASHDNTMWRFIVREFGGPDGKASIVDGQTHLLRVTRVMRSAKSDGSFNDLNMLMKSSVDHRASQAIPIREWHSSLHKITSSVQKM